MVDRMELPVILKDEKNLKNYFLNGQLFFHHNILADNISREGIAAHLPVIGVNKISNLIA